MIKYPYARQSIDMGDIAEVGAALASDIITRGKHVEAFEQAVAKYCGASYAVAFNSGTSALHAAAFAANMGQFDRVVTSPNTFVATAIAGMARQSRPILVDIDLETGNLNLDQMDEVLSSFFSSRGKAVVFPVHFSGIPVDMQQLDRRIRHPDIMVIEDAAHALGAEYKDGQKVGCCAWSQMTVFSFHPTKTITTGEGGMVTTNDVNLYKKLCLYRNNGISRDPGSWEADPNYWYEGYYEVQTMSGNYNFTDFQAALGLCQLKRIDQFIAKRRELNLNYRRLLRDFPGVRLLAAEFDHLSACHLFVVQIDYNYYQTTRAQLIAQLKERGIGTQVHYIPLYRHPAFREKTKKDLTEEFPNMEMYYSQALTLPLYYDLHVSDVEKIVETLKGVLEQSLNQKKYQRAPFSHHRNPNRKRGARH